MVSGLDIDTAEVAMMAAIVDNVLCQPEFFLLVRRKHGGFSVKMAGQSEKIHVEWHQSRLFDYPY